MSNEMLKMRQQLECLQAELCARGGGTSADEIQVINLKYICLDFYIRGLGVGVREGNSLLLLLFYGQLKKKKKLFNCQILEKIDNSFFTLNSLFILDSFMQVL